MSIVYEANTFHGGAVSIGNASWYRNTFNGSRLIVDALPAEFAGNAINDCAIEFVRGGPTPIEFANWVAPREPGLAVALRDWVAKGGWTPPTVH
jgi:hypothetical protein